MPKDKKPKPEPRPEGRPTKYDPKYCQMLVKHMASGFSYESFAGVLGVFRATLYNWEASHPEFLDAKKEGSDRNLLFWEKTGMQGMWGDKESNMVFNPTVWIFNMKNRHKWKDKVESEVTVNDSESDKLKKMSTEELKKFIQEMEEKK